MSLYKALLREVDAWISAARSQKAAQLLNLSAPPPTNSLDTVHKTLREVIRDQFRAKKKEQDAVEILTYLRSQRTYKMLLDRYNPTATLEDHERVRLTARRVGLELPKDIQKRIKED